MIRAEASDDRAQSSSYVLEESTALSNWTTRVLRSTPLRRGATLALFLVLWEVSAAVGIVNPLFFPAPTDIGSASVSLAQQGELSSAAFATVRRLLLGFALGALPAVLLGVLMGLSQTLRALMRPVISVAYPLPKTALLPLLILIFGIGENSRYAIVALGVFFPVLVNTVGGVLGIPEVYRNVGRNFGANTWHEFTTIAIPGALPQIFTGLRVGSNTALIVVVTVEMLFSNTGLGHLIWNSWQIFFIEQMYVSLFIVAVMGFLMTKLTDLTEQWVIPWKISITSY